jgi:hypothetical protein
VNEVRLFVTQSLNVAAWLISKGFVVMETVKICDNNDSNLSFCFERTNDLINSVDEYNGNVELKKFIGAFKDVKRMVVEGKMMG